MNKRGQAALEYLMTYGWALIVIAIVVGVLVFIVSTPTGQLRCSSDDPTKLNVVGNDLLLTAANSVAGAVGTEVDLGDIIVTNLTGGSLNLVTVTGSGAFASHNDTAGGLYTLNGLDAVDAIGVGNTNINVMAGELAAEGTHSSSTLQFDFTDLLGFAQTVTVTCQGANVVIT